jgi:type II secretory pathway pseudopilin PulG
VLSENVIYMNKINTQSQTGYTLVEVLISLFIFIAIAIPMLTGVFTNTGSLRSEEALVAAWILEQEAATVRLFPEEIVQVRRRIIDGKEWIVLAEQTGAPLVRVDLTALHQRKKCGRVIVYALKNGGGVP